MPDRSDEPVWVVVALAYDKDSAGLVDKSISCGEYDIDIGADVLDQIHINCDWVPDAVPGLYRLDLQGWSDEDDGGWDVAKATLLQAFPERQQDELREVPDFEDDLQEIEASLEVETELDMNPIYKQ